MTKGSAHFVLTAGIWLGEGVVKLSIADEELKFITRWTVSKPKKNGLILSSQEVQIGGVSEIMKNMFSFSNLTEEAFEVSLENENLGKVTGTGIYRPELLAWEFRNNPLGFEGFELYQLLDDGSYFMHAEYITKEDFRTQIQGKLWRKVAPS